MIVVFILLILVIGVFIFQKKFTITRKSTVSSQKITTNANLTTAMQGQDNKPRCKSYDYLSISEERFEQISYKKVSSLDLSVIKDIDNRYSGMVEEKTRIENIMSTINVELLQIFIELSDKLKRTYRQTNDCKKEELYPLMIKILSEIISKESAVDFFTVPIWFGGETLKYPSELLYEFIVANDVEENYRNSLQIMSSLWIQMRKYMERAEKIKDDIASLNTFCYDNRDLLKILRDSQV